LKSTSPLLSSVWLTVRFEYAQYLVAGEESHLGDPVRITQNDTDLRGSKALAGEFCDLFDDVFRCSFEPGWGGTAIR
jgi:hypothetical protein